MNYHRRLSFVVFFIALAVAYVVLGTSAVRASSHELQKFGKPEFKCVAKKQKAAGKYCLVSMKAWSKWLTAGDDGKRDDQLGKASTGFTSLWSKAEEKSAKKEVDCTEQTVDAVSMGGSIETTVDEIVTEIRSGLDLGDSDQAKCGAKLLKAAGKQCAKLLKVESKHVKKAPKGGSGAKRAEGMAKAAGKFATAWSKAATACPSDATLSDIESRLNSAVTDVVYDTVVAPGLNDAGYEPISPVGLVEYEGRMYEPRCAFDDDPDYHFFVKRGSVNKLVMYYQGGGACWENVTCSVPVCKDGADPTSDDPDNFSNGFADLSNPDNPFKDWNAVFVTYCSCDIHAGDSDQTYTGFFDEIHVVHHGYHNSKVAEKFAREHFLNPDMIFVTGSSAGGYGALFSAPQLAGAWPAADMRVLGDASNGVITPDFLQNEFSNWNFEANLPDIPGVMEAITSGAGMPAYQEAVSRYFPDIGWANYTAAYDGGSGGQTGFYNVMLNGNDPLAALTWWEGSCAFESLMRAQALDTYAAVSAPGEPDNYRYYIGTGSRHTMWGNNKVYSDQTGGEPQTVRDWIVDMLAYDPGVSSAAAWQNATCTDCGIVLPGDPQPGTLEDPFFDDGFGGVEIICP